MTINLGHELEQLILRDVERGPYKTAKEFVERAVLLLHEQEEWLSVNRAEVAIRIEEGYVAAQRGELIDAEAVRTQMDEMKHASRTERHSG
jgi:Arc/MetJ-type ribon-helix-helix transcriptional regulator